MWKILSAKFWCSRFSTSSGVGSKGSRWTSPVSTPDRTGICWGSDCFMSRMKLIPELWTSSSLNWSPRTLDPPRRSESGSLTLPLHSWDSLCSWQGPLPCSHWTSLNWSPPDWWWAWWSVWPDDWCFFFPALPNTSRYGTVGRHRWAGHSSVGPRQRRAIWTTAIYFQNKTRPPNSRTTSCHPNN